MTKPRMFTIEETDHGNPRRLTLPGDTLCAPFPRYVNPPTPHRFKVQRAADGRLGVPARGLTGPETVAVVEPIRLDSIPDRTGFLVDDGAPDGTWGTYALAHGQALEEQYLADGNVISKEVFDAGRWRGPTNASLAAMQEAGKLRAVLAPLHCAEHDQCATMSVAVHANRDEYSVSVGGPCCRAFHATVEAAIRTIPA